MIGDDVVYVYVEKGVYYIGFVDGLGMYLVFCSMKVVDLCWCNDWYIVKL